MHFVSILYLYQLYFPVLHQIQPHCTQGRLQEPTQKVPQQINAVEVVGQLTLP